MVEFKEDQCKYGKKVWIKRKLHDDKSSKDHMEGGGPMGPFSILFWHVIENCQMWWPGQVTAEALKREISRRERVKRIKEIIGCYSNVRIVARYLAAWMYSWLGVEYSAGCEEEGDWYHKKSDTIRHLEEDYGDATSDLYRRFQWYFMRDIHYPPRS